MATPRDATCNNARMFRVNGVYEAASMHHHAMHDEARDPLVRANATSMCARLPACHLEFGHLNDPGYPLDLPSADLLASTSHHGMCRSQS